MVLLLAMATPAGSVAPMNGHERAVAGKSGFARRGLFASECKRRKRKAGNRGTLAGAAGGAVVGAAAMATPIGVGVGALAGHTLAKRKHC